MMYNSTRHTSLGKTPNEMLRNKTIQTRLPLIKNIRMAPPVDPETVGRDLVNEYNGKEKEDIRIHFSRQGLGFPVGMEIMFLFWMRMSVRNSKETARI